MGTPVIGSDSAASTRPITIARTAPPSERPRLTSQLRIGDASTSLR